MAKWTASLDKPITSEPANAGNNCVAYVTYTSDDGRTAQSVRTPFAPGEEDNLLAYVARQCANLSAIDDRTSAANAAAAASPLKAGALALPDLSAQQAALQAQADLDAKVQAALQSKMLKDAIAVDPTITAAQAAVATAQASAAKPAKASKLN